MACPRISVDPNDRVRVHALAHADPSLCHPRRPAPAPDPAGLLAAGRARREDQVGEAPRLEMRAARRSSTRRTIARERALLPRRRGRVRRRRRVSGERRLCRRRQGLRGGADRAAAERHPLHLRRSGLLPLRQRRASAAACRPARRSRRRRRRTSTCSPATARSSRSRTTPRPGASRRSTRSLTGRYQKNFGGKVADRRRVRHHPEGACARSAASSGAPADPYNAGNGVGGYCTFLGGKFTGSTGDPGFDAHGAGTQAGPHQLRAGRGGGPPHCGSAAVDDYVQPDHDLQHGGPVRVPREPFLRLPGSTPARLRDAALLRLGTRPAYRTSRSARRRVIQNYLFGGLTPPALGGLLDLGKYCNGASCPPMVTAFTESNFGNRVRLLRQHLVGGRRRARGPRVPRQGRRTRTASTTTGRVATPSPARRSARAPGRRQCRPTSPRNTVMIYMTDNGWFLPNSKHAFTENGYRTPHARVRPAHPADACRASTARSRRPRRPTRACRLAHSTDVLPTALGYALGTPGSQLCPVSADGTRVRRPGPAPLRVSGERRAATRARRSATRCAATTRSAPRRRPRSATC